MENLVMCGYSNMLSLIDNSNLSDNDKIQKRNELFFLSEFINYSEKDIAIVPKLREKPDFEVSYKGNSVLQSAFCGIYYYSHLSDTRITTIKSLEI